MSDNELDQITQELKGAFRQAVDAGHAYMRYLRGKGHSGVRKLTGAERREMAQRIRAEVNGERLAAAWFAKRVQDYQREQITYRALIQQADPREVPEIRARMSERLGGMRYSIESTMHNTALRIEHRGQVVEALDNVERGVGGKVTPQSVYYRLDQQSALAARARAVESELRIDARRRESDQLISTYQTQQQRRTDPAVLAAENDALRRRVAELESGDQAVSGSATAAPETGNRSAGENRRGPGEPIRMVFQDSVARYNAVQQIRHAQTQLRDAVAEGRATEADHRRARSVTAAAAQVLGEERAAVETDNAEANSRAVMTISATTKDGTAMEYITYHPDEAVAASVADQEVNQAPPGTTFTVRAREAGQTEPFYTAEGSQAEVARDTEFWVSETRDGFGRTQQPSQSEPARAAERDRLRGDVESLQTRLNLSIGHNNELDGRNAALIRQLTAMTAERDRLLGERDEAVQKLAERTPADQRYGSPERQAEQAKAAANRRAPEDGAGRSALADYEPGRTLADAVARNGAERDGLER